MYYEKMKTVLKYGIILTLIAVSMGVFAGILAGTFDLSLVEAYFLPLMAILIIDLSFN
jgi:hypothetical protein